MRDIKASAVLVLGSVFVIVGCDSVPSSATDAGDVSDPDGGLRPGDGGALPGDGGALAPDGGGAQSDAGTLPPPGVPSCTGETGTTYYVREDGGDATQCTGLVDAAYSGAGAGQACAWSHPFVALPPGGAARIEGGDRLIIADGSYGMGVGAPGVAASSACSESNAWECSMPPIPSGPDAAHPTCIVGAGWNDGCGSGGPELYAVERPDQIIDLTGSDHVRVECLELTDHSDCVAGHSGDLECPSYYDFPHGPYGMTGVSARGDSSDVTLRNLDVHGLAHTGMHVYRVRDWTLEQVRIAANGWVGWDGDMYDTDVSNSGTLLFRGVTIEWNGCGETLDGEPTGCWAQTAGGYGDGLGTGRTGGDWIFEDCVIRHNTSDGLDLLYRTLGGTITVRRTIAAGNAGNQIKTAGTTSIENSVIISDCSFFEGQPFTHHVDPCRALGAPLNLSFTGGETMSIVSSTIYGETDVLIGAGPREGTGCDGSERIVALNNIFIGDTEYLSPDDRSVLFYQEGCGDLSFDERSGVIFGTRDNSQSGCAPENGDLCADPRVVGPLHGGAYDVQLRSDSPAIDSGLEVGAMGLIPDHDLLGRGRPAGAGVDRGAYERQP